MRLLLIEDNPIDQDLVRAGFRDSDTGDERVDLTVVESVEAARGLLAAQTFDVIITDYSLPEQSGLDLLRSLRESSTSTPVVILTGMADVTVAVAALQEGAADFVVKDIAFERALPVVTRRVLDKHASEVEHRREREQLRERVRHLEQRLDVQSADLRRALQESEALRRVAQALATGEPSAALDLVPKAAAQMLQAQAAAVLLQHGSDYVLASASGTSKQAPGLKARDLPTQLARDWGSVVSATIREGRETIGLLWVGRLRSGTFAVHEVNLLEALADLSALSIGKLRMAEQLRRLRDPTASRATPSVEDVPLPREPDTVAVSCEDPPAPEAEEVVAAIDNGSLAPPAVLVVDDSERVLAQARCALETSMTVLTATSGRSAIEAYATSHPSVVVVDLVMPDMDGFTTLAKLQELGCASSIAMALRGDVRSHERARKAGCLAVIEKPLRDGELLAQITAVLGGGDSSMEGLVSECDGHPMLTLPNGSAKTLQSLIPFFLQRLRSFAESGNDRMVLDATSIADVTPDQVSLLARLFAAAVTLGLRAAICVPDDRVVAKLRQIVELRDAEYVQSLTAAATCLQ